MRAVISAVGKDSTGVIAAISAACAECNANIEDIAQTVLHGYFNMIMIVSIDHLNVPFTDFVDKMANLSQKTGLQISAMHEDIFSSMHNI